MSPLPNLSGCCVSGNTRRDPWTGDERCEFCGLPVPLPNVAGAALHGAESPEPVPPIVLGGQGRDASEVVDDGDNLVRLLIIAGFLVAIVAVGAWAAGGGR